MMKILDRYNLKSHFELCNRTQNLFIEQLICPDLVPKVHGHKILPRYLWDIGYFFD